MTTNLHQKILNEFLNSNIKIKSLDRLKEYINENGYSKTSYHHILPKAKDCFPEFKDLKVNKWNGTHLYHKDHYYIHWLLTEAIDNYGQLFAFCLMHNMDTKLGRIDELDLISAKKFQKKMEERNKEISKWRENNSEKVKLAAKKRLKSIDWAKQSILISRGLKVIEENGKTKAQNASIRTKLKRLNDIDENGKNSFKRATDKRIENMKNNIDENGKNAIERAALKMSQTRKQIGKDGLSSYQRSEKNKQNNVVYQHIIIYDANNKIMFNCPGNFNQICEDNNLPKRQLGCYCKINKKWQYNI